MVVTRGQQRHWQPEGWTGEPFGPPRLDGGRLCLDFANTVGYRESERPQEFLTSYAVLVAWALYLGVVDDEEAGRLRRLAEDHPDEAAAVHSRATVLRDTIYRLFAAIARNEEPDVADIDAVYQVYREALEHARVRQVGDGFGWQWLDRGENLNRPLWPVAWSAVDVLVSNDLGRLKMCMGADGDSCFWLFLDETKNRIRRFCNTNVCGTGAKVRRQTARRRAARASRG